MKVEIEVALGVCRRFKDWFLVGKETKSWRHGGLSRSFSRCVSNASDTPARADTRANGFCGFRSRNSLLEVAVESDDVPGMEKRRVKHGELGIKYVSISVVSYTGTHDTSG